MITRIVAASNVRPGHVVTMPSAGPHLTQRLMTDVELLLADTIASVTAKERMIVFQPVAVAVCTRCQEAYTEARRVIEEARGLAGVDGEDRGSGAMGLPNTLLTSWPKVRVPPRSRTPAR
jgi:hypothetical protein